MTASAKDFVEAGGAPGAGERVTLVRAPIPEPEPRTRVGERKRLAECALTVREALRVGDPAYRSLFMAGGWPLGYYGFCHGQSAIGKTRELLRAVVLRSLAMPWHCWQPSLERFKPIILSLEMGTPSVAHILREIADQIGGRDAVEQVVHDIVVVGAPQLQEPFRARASCTGELIEAIEKHGCNFALIDSLTELKTTGGDGPEDFHSVVEMLSGTARATNACILGVHHNRRHQPDGRHREDPTDRFRGPSVILDAARWACSFDPQKDGCVRIKWHKVTFGARPQDSYFKLDDHGLPGDATREERKPSVGAANRHRVLQVVAAAPGPITRGEIETVTGLSQSAANDHLKTLITSGHVQRLPNNTYCLSPSRPPESEQGGSVS